MSDMLMRRLDRLANRLESLREPFSKDSTLNESVDMNASLRYALMKAKEVFADQFRFEKLNDPSGTPTGEHLEKLPRIFVEMDLQEDLPPLNTVPEMLNEAFKVLIKNAVEAIAEKNLDNRLISIRSELLPGNQVMITIQDNGAGIKPAYLEKVFELGTTTKNSGLGFGLFWTKDFIKGLGGTIDISSSWGEGTTIHICLPTTNGLLHSD
jgi:signal transduction histidine kinase